LEAEAARSTQLLEVTTVVIHNLIPLQLSAVVAEAEVPETLTLITADPVAVRHGQATQELREVLRKVTAVAQQVMVMLVQLMELHPQTGAAAAQVAQAQLDKLVLIHAVATVAPEDNILNLRNMELA
jgi:hypothetical protein